MRHFHVHRPRSRAVKYSGGIISASVLKSLGRGAIAFSDGNLAGRGNGGNPGKAEVDLGPLRRLASDNEHDGATAKWLARFSPPLLGRDSRVDGTNRRRSIGDLGKFLSSTGIGDVQENGGQIAGWWSFYDMASCVSSVGR